MKYNKSLGKITFPCKTEIEVLENPRAFSTCADQELKDLLVIRIDDSEAPGDDATLLSSPEISEVHLMLWRRNIPQIIELLRGVL